MKDISPESLDQKRGCALYTRQNMVNLIKSSDMALVV